MDRQQKRAAIAAYKERKPAFGVYAVICRATGEVWVGCSRHVDTQKNGIWFTLRTGGHKQASMQQAFTAHGEDSFDFEELDRLREDYPQIGRMDELKRRQSLWAARLHARAV